MRGRNGDVGRTNYSIRAVHRVCEILDLLQQAPRGAALLDVARATRLPKSSAFRYLATLERRRYVERDPVTGSYRAGSAFLPLRAHEPELLARRARPHMERLRDRLGETINLGMLEGNRVSYLPAAISYSAPASRFPLDRVGEIAGVLWEVASGVAGELRAPSR